MTITIVGSGMAGLLAANMLARHQPRIIEAQPELPNNHSAVLRFGSDKVAEVTGIPFRKVKMIKGSLAWKNPVADALAYAAKCGGTARSDRSIPIGLERAERWIAPPDLIARMAKDIKIEFGITLAMNEQDLQSRGNDKHSVPAISTIPMPALMHLLAYPDAPKKFDYVSGANLRFTVANCDAYASLYIPSPAYRFNRISVTGNEVIAEFAFPHGMPALNRHDMGNMEFAICDMLGIKTDQIENITFTPQHYAKILPIDDDARKAFMHWATVNHNIYSLGRYATWKPGLLLDDLVHDIRKIESWVLRGNKYDVARDR